MYQVHVKLSREILKISYIYFGLRGDMNQEPLSYLRADFS